MNSLLLVLAALCFLKVITNDGVDYIEEEYEPSKRDKRYLLAQEYQKEWYEFAHLQTTAHQGYQDEWTAWEDAA
ncbi:MAG: hypothetical protein AAF959_14185 [Cyanobacteria bacterium P01_D01_bin.56]